MPHRAKAARSRWVLPLVLGGLLLLLLPSLLNPYFGERPTDILAGRPVGAFGSSQDPRGAPALAANGPTSRSSPASGAAFAFAADPTPGARPLPPQPYGTVSGCSTCAFYFQEGVHIDRMCLENLTVPCTSHPGIHSGAVEVSAEPGPYMWGQEFNGLSNTGDWYQSSVLYNWCGPGFGWGNEAFDAAGASVYPTSGGVTCISGVTIHAGDTVQIGLYFPTSGAQLGDACFYFDDVTAGSGGVQNCITQPDPGSSPASNYFQWGGSGGFFTGIMSEYVDPNATSCEPFQGLPTGDYRTAPGGFVTQFTPFADEWDPATNSTCFSTLGSVPTENQTPMDAVPAVTDISGGTTYGAHWLSTQNTSGSSASTWWQMETDATLGPPQAPRSASDAGQFSSGTFSAPVHGYSIDGTTVSEGWTTPPGLGRCSPTAANQSLACQLNSTPGRYPVTYTISESPTTEITSLPLVYTIYPTMTLGPPAVEPSHVDIGQPIALSVTVVNGSGPSEYDWNGLPPGCSADRLAPRPTCAPSEAGIFSVAVNVIDTVGAMVPSAYVRVVVFADPTLGAISTDPGSGVVDAHQNLSWNVTVTGGSGGTVFTWSGLPRGCSGSTGGSLQCAPSEPAVGTVQVRATDSDGFATPAEHASFQVLGDPTVAMTSAPPSETTGRSFLLGVAVAGGRAPYTLRWSGLPTSCASANSTQLLCTTTSVGSYAITVTVIDSFGVSNTTSTTLTIGEAPAPGLGATPMELLLLALAGLVTAAVVIAGALVTLRRKGRSPPSTQGVDDDPSALETSTEDARPPFEPPPDDGPP